MSIPFYKFSWINLRLFLSPHHYFDRLQLALPPNVALNPFSSSTQIPLHRSHFSSIATSFHLVIDCIGYFRLGPKAHTVFTVGPTTLSTSHIDMSQDCAMEGAREKHIDKLYGGIGDGIGLALGDNTSECKGRVLAIRVT